MKLFVDLVNVLPRLSLGDIGRFSIVFEMYSQHLPSISSELYEKLDTEDQQRFVVWFLKRWAKIDLINPVELGLYRNKIQSVKEEHRANVQFMEKTYKLRDFASQGHDFSLLGYDWFLGVHDIFYNQYEHKQFSFRRGDVIIDAGAFIGDTAVLFYRRLEGMCNIHCFELLDENIALLNHNLEINQVDSLSVVVNKLALSDSSNGEIIIADGKTQGSTSMFGNDASGSRVRTITLDDYVVSNDIARLDVIKMDIEGAELPALHGAFHSIQRFRPRLALCLYHKWDDIITIPRFIESTGVEYNYYFKWVQLSEGWEAVLLAVPKDHEGDATGPRCGGDVLENDSATSAIHRAFDVLNKAYLKKNCHPAATVR